MMRLNEEYIEKNRMAAEYLAAQGKLGELIRKQRELTEERSAAGWEWVGLEKHRLEIYEEVQRELNDLKIRK